MTRLKIRLALAACTFCVLSAQAQSPSECQLKAGVFLEQFNEQMTQVVRTHDVRRDAIIAEGLPAIANAQERNDTRLAVEASVVRANIASKKESLSEYAVKTLNAAVQGNAGACESFDWFDNTLNDSRNRLATELLRLEKLVASRLAATNLGPNEGFAIIAVYSSGFSQSIHLNRRKSIKKSLQIGPLNSEQYFEVVRLKAGEYNWSTVKLGRNRPYYFYDFSDKDLSFKIVAGKLNYTGVYVFERLGQQHATADINDRASIVLQIMERRFPDLLTTYDIANGLIPDDTFINFYLTEKARRLGAAQ